MISKTIGFRGLAYFQTPPYGSQNVLVSVSSRPNKKTGIFRPGSKRLGQGPQPGRQGMPVKSAAMRSQMFYGAEIASGNLT